MDSKYTFEEQSDLLNLAAERYNRPEFIASDPIQFPHRYQLKQDIEVSAFLTATITWGKRPLILKSAEKMHRIMGNSPYTYIMEGRYEKLGQANIHRTFFEHDMAYLCRGLYAIYREYESCEALFAAQPAGNDRLWQGLALFRDRIMQANDIFSQRSNKHISNPATAACKRLHLALKWLVRNDGIVDLGIWPNISPSELKIPLDIHVIRTSHQLGLLTRKQNDRKAVDELTANLKRFNPNDPILYDYALFGLSESGWVL
ncbi:TIGR02757 family protein [Parabacteroides sp. OttesenSCG-928-G06]|nr:TIGR02757 family protein [Parabacteroides sp. OttesenSCG-928-K15]MDL2281675.1 TIGR02757 family protein [Parabacteroides sp. OttesenSCG-928-G06]